MCLHGLIMHLYYSYCIETTRTQGCLPSPSLYAVSIQVAIDFINKQSNIRGVQLLGETLKVSAFADNLAVSCRDEKDI